MNETERRLQEMGGTIVGLVLIGLGVLFLLDRYFEIGIAGYIWPLFILIPGIVIFAWSLRLSEPSGIGMAIAGGIVTMLGLVLFVQNLTGLWATWAYAWALVAPTAVGLGMMLYGWIKNRQGIIHDGRDVARVGLGLFIGFGAFFELGVNISGLGLNRIGWPLLLIGLGVWILLRQLRATRRTL